MKILLFGASGAGTTTLGSELEKQVGFKHLDADSYYWKPTSPPFQEKVPLEERNTALQSDFKTYEKVAVSGSMVSWGKHWESAFDLAVFIYLRNEVRMERLKNREMKRYGNDLHNNLDIQRNSEEFLAWAARYEDPEFNGRSLKIHNGWIKLIKCPVLRLDGEMGLQNKVDKILSILDGHE